MQGKKSVVGIPISEKQAITEENYAKVAEAIIAPLDKVTGNRTLAYSPLSMSKLRSIYSLITNIYTRVNNRDDFEDCKTDLQYIKVKMAYESGRDQAVKDFIKKTFLMYLLDAIATYDQFILYCRYAESLVAYFKFYGGKE